MIHGTLSSHGLPALYTTWPSQTYFTSFLQQTLAQETCQTNSGLLCKVADLVVMSPSQTAELDILKLVLQVAGFACFLVNSEQFDVDPIRAATAEHVRHQFAVLAECSPTQGYLQVMCLMCQCRNRCGQEAMVGWQLCVYQDMAYGCVHLGRANHSSHSQNTAR